jgi:hypothetical protein
MDLGDKAVSI